MADGQGEVSSDEWRALAALAGRHADFYRRVQARLVARGVDVGSPLHGYCRLASWNALRIEAVALELATEAAETQPAKLPRWVNRPAPG